MKRFVVGTAPWLAVLAVVGVIALDWPVVFLLVALSASLYLVLGRRTDIELRMGVGRGGGDKRLYAAVVWKRGAKVKSEAAVEDSEFDAVKAEDRV